MYLITCEAKFYEIPRDFPRNKFSINSKENTKPYMLASRIFDFTRYALFKNFL